MPNENALTYLDQLLFHGNDQLPQKTYGENPTNEFDVDRCLNGLPCWGEISIGSEKKRSKKLIVTDWSLCFGVGDRSEVQKMWEFLLYQHAEIYVWTGKLIKADNICVLMAALLEVEPITREEIYRRFSQSDYKIAKDNCEIIDSQRVQEILFNLQSMIVDSKKQESPFLTLDFTKADNEELFLSESISNTFIKEIGINLILTVSSAGAVLKYLRESNQKVHNLSIKSDNLNKSTLCYFDEIMKENHYFFPNLETITIPSTEKKYLSNIRLSLFSKNTKIKLIIEIENKVDYQAYLSFIERHNQKIIEVKLINRKDLLLSQSISLLKPISNYLTKLSINVYIYDKAHQEDLGDVPFFENLVEIHFCNLIDSQIGSVLRQCPNIKKIDLFGLDLKGGFFSDIHFNHLTVFECPAKVYPHGFFIDEARMAALTSCENLLSLKLGRVNFSFSCNFIESCRKSYSLQYLEINEDVFFNKNSLYLNFINLFPRLVSLNIKKFSFNFSDILLLGSHLPNLEEIYINSITEIKKIDSLKSMYFGKVKKVSFGSASIDVIKALSMLFPNMEELSVKCLSDSKSSCFGGQSDPSKFFSKNLKKIRIENCDGEDLFEAIDLFPNLEYLIVSNIYLNPGENKKSNFIRNKKILCLEFNGGFEVYVCEYIFSKFNRIDFVFFDDRFNVHPISEFYFFNILLNFFSENPGSKIDFGENLEIIYKHILCFFENISVDSLFVKGLFKLSLPEVNNVLCLSGDRVSKIIVNASNLFSLELGKFSGEVFFDHDFEHRSLRSIIFSDKDVSFESIFNIVNVSPHLERVSIPLFSDDEDFGKFEEIFPHIRFGSSDCCHKKNSPESIHPIKNDFYCLEQSIVNQSLTVDFVDKDKPKLLDVITVEDKSDELHVRTIFEGCMMSNQYRISVYPDIELGEHVIYSSKNYPIEFIKTFSVAKNLYGIYQDQYKNSPDIYYGQWHIPAGCKDWFPLPSLSVNDELLDLTAGVFLQLGYCKAKDLYYVKPTTPSMAPIPIAFILKTNELPTLSFYSNHPLKFNFLSFNKDGKLDEKNHYYETFMNKWEKLTIKEKQQAILSFCRGFVSQEIKVNSHHDIDKLNAILQARAGACRHRAWIAMALSKELGIEARAVENDCHAFIEMKNEGQWCRVDLGGFQSHLMLEPMSCPDTFIPPLGITDEKIVTATIQEVQQEALEIQGDYQVRRKEKSSKTIVLTDQNPFKTWDTESSKAKTWESYCSELILKAKQLPSANQNILVILDEDQIEAFHEQMTKYLARLGKNYHYLSQLDEVPECQVLIEEGNLKITDSTLIRFIKEAKEGEVLMSDWSHYGPKNVGMNTMIDIAKNKNCRKIKTHLISPDAIVMAILAKNKMDDMGEDFYSRFMITSEAPPLEEKNKLEAQLTLNAGQKAPNQIEAHFFNDDWKGLLLGRIHINIKKGVQQFEMEEGLLIRAIKNNQPLLVVNAPWNRKDFRMFLTELLNNRWIEYNGEKIKLPDQFHMGSTRRLLKLQSKLFCFDSYQQKSKKEDFLLNSKTFKHFLRCIECHQPHLEVKPGFIKQHENGEMKLLVSETLSANAWANLIYLAEKHDCKFHIQLAEGVDIPQEMNVDTRKLTRFISNNQVNRLIVTNDIDLAEEELFDKNTLTISINRETRFSDLIEKQNRLQKETDQLLSFELKIGTVWKKLMEGGNVILKGQLSLDLARELESLFMNPPYLWVNGKKEKPRGRLIIISDIDPMLSFVKVENKNYTHDSIFKVLDERYGKNASYLKFKKSFDKINKQHSEIIFSYVQINAMAEQVVRGDLSNPFKRFLRQDPRNLFFKTAKKVWEREKSEKENCSMRRRSEKVNKILVGHPFLFLIGPSGVGKSTYILNELKNDGRDVYVGLDHLPEWLDKKTNKEKILFIDEANLEREGAWDIFEGIFNKTPGILLNGNFHPVSEKHKVIFSGNYAYFEGRQCHHFFERHGQMISFKEMPDRVLCEKIILPTLKMLFPDTDENKEMAKTLLDVYHYLNEKLSDHPMTPRNLKTICLRLAELSHHVDESQKLNDIMCIAIMDEVENMFANKEGKKDFKNKIGLTGKIKGIKKTINDHYSFKIENFIVTPSRVRPLKLLHKQFLMRNMLSKNKNLENFDIPGLLFEGSSGIGKSRMVVEYLEAQDYRLGNLNEAYGDTVDTRKLYYHLTPTDPRIMEKTLLKAFHEGAIVIIDELNSLPLERILNQLLSGYDLEGNRAKKKGFLIVGTQNPVSFTGRKVLSLAMENRLKKYNLTDYLNEELEEIAEKTCDDKKWKNDVLRDYRDASVYAKQCHKKPSPTPRNLFSYLLDENKKEKQTGSVALMRKNEFSSEENDSNLFFQRQQQGIDKQCVANFEERNQIMAKEKKDERFLKMPR